MKFVAYQLNKAKNYGKDVALQLKSQFNEKEVIESN